MLVLQNPGPAEAYYGSVTGLGPAVIQQIDASGRPIITSAAIADLNGDGLNDVVFPTSDAIEVFVSMGTRGQYQNLSTPAPGQSPLVSVQPNRVEIADIDGDSSLDVAYMCSFVLGGQQARGLTVALRFADGVFGRVLRNDQVFAYRGGVLGGRIDPDLADVNADGRIDVAFGQDVFLGDGAGSFAAPAEINPQQGSFDYADFDGDGRLDLLSGSTIFFNQCRAPLCPADLTSDAAGPPDGLVTLSDFVRYLDLWSAGAPAADITATNVCLPGQTDGRVDLSDFACYLRFWASGCP